jgi:hypothetical protein
MAKIPLNSPKTIPVNITTNLVGIYTCPIGVSAYVLLMNVANVSTGSSAGTYKVTATFERPTGLTGIGVSLVEKYLVKEIEIPVNDSMNLIPDGRLILENDPRRATAQRSGGDTIKISSNSNDKLELLLSVLETAKL